MSRARSETSRVSPSRRGRRVRPSRLAAVGLALLALGAGAPASGAQDAGTEMAQRAALTLDELLARFRSIPGLYARYREDKRIALLAEPIVSEGTVHYAPPRRIARHGRVPTESHVVLDAESLRFGDGTTTRQVDLGASPVLRAIVESFLDVLAGDRAGLERSFIVDFHSRDGGKRVPSWRLGLVPRTPALLAVLTEMSFEGEGLVVSRMRIREASGDEGVTTFSDVDIAHRYSPEEAARVFRIDP
jgi:hypothetical protein